MIVKIKIVIAYIQYIVQLLYYYQSQDRILIDQDVDRWAKELSLPYRSHLKLLVYLLRFYPQFRNLFYFRCKSVLNIFKRLCPPDKRLTIADCQHVAGGSMFFVHAFGTHIYLKSIGYGCIIRHLTTFGVKSTQRFDEIPTVGNNVDFGANVTCIGNIVIGDGAVVGAGSVVTKDVPPNAIVAGNPAKIIGYKNDGAPA